MDKSGEIPMGNQLRNCHEIQHFNPFSYGEFHHFPMVSIGVPSGYVNSLLLKIDHRNSGFSQLQNGGSFQFVVFVSIVMLVIPIVDFP